MPWLCGLCLVVLMYFGAAPSLAAATTLSEDDFRSFLSSEGGNGCLLNSGSSRGGLLIQLPSSSELMVFDVNSTGACQIGEANFHCVRAPIHDPTLARLDNACNAACATSAGNLRYAQTCAWLPDSSLVQELARNLGPAHVSVSISETAGFFFEEPDSQGVSPGVLVSDSGEVSTIVAMTPAMRALDPDEIRMRLSSYGIPADMLRWIGIDDTLVTSDLRIHRSGSIVADHLDETRLHDRIQEFNSVFTIEEISGADISDIHKNLMLTLLDPGFRSKLLIDFEFFMDPSLYLVK